ncbi:MAG TPA: chemotaxis protein CheB [Catenuloplanes sp.]|jgi:two-component system chemotaxis response regulator CheB
MNDFPVIALVCSAGGLRALTAVLATLPADLPAAVLVLQHLEPERASQLPAILSTRTALTVDAAADGDVLSPGRVLVAPSGQHTLIDAAGTVALIPSGTVPPYRPSADLLLTTLAIAAGPRVVAVVLSGTGNDAATGVTAVHRFGGTVIAGSLESSSEPAMPQAAIDRGGVVDHVIPLDEVAGLLIALTTAPTISPAGADQP